MRRDVGGKIEIRPVGTRGACHRTGDRHILRPMNDGYAWWLVLVGLAVGLGVMWLALVRLPRDEDDIDLDEREHEAGWIGATIESRGGICPQPLAVEVLELHHEYLISSGGGAPLRPRVSEPEPEVATP